MAGTAGTAIARGIPTARYPSTYKLYALGAEPEWAGRHDIRITVIVLAKISNSAM